MPMATKALTISVTAQTSYTIWPGTTVPGTVDAGPDDAVELGVSFAPIPMDISRECAFTSRAPTPAATWRSLWSSTGARLATATFANETASGWQQVSFATPVAVTANTVYIASYHTNIGHYSDD